MWPENLGPKLLSMRKPTHTQEKKKGQTQTPNSVASLGGGGGGSPPPKPKPSLPFFNFLHFGMAAPLQDRPAARPACAGPACAGPPICWTAQIFATVPDALHTIVFPSWNWMLATLIDDSASRSYRTRVVEECADLSNWSHGVGHFFQRSLYSRVALPSCKKQQKRKKKCVWLLVSRCVRHKKKESEKEKQQPKTSSNPRNRSIWAVFPPNKLTAFFDEFRKQNVSSFLCDPYSLPKNVNETCVLGSQGQSTRGCMREWSPGGSGTKLCASFGVVCNV